jgi:sirohydrochlorin ferrochelatase
VKTGVVVFAHGSRVESANEAVRAVAAELARRSPDCDIEPAFLELGQPDLAEAINRLAGRGATRIVVIPYFLTLGLHLERDLPVLVAGAARAFPDIRITVTPPLDGHPALAQIVEDRLKASAR